MQTSFLQDPLLNFTAYWEMQPYNFFFFFNYSYYLFWWTKQMYFLPFY